MPWSRVTLRRGSDRIQAWLTLVLVVVALVVAPWAAWWAASTAYLTEVRAGASERQHRHPVAAVLTQDAAGVNDDGQAPPPPANVFASAYWTGPDGEVHAGAVPVEGGTRAGSTVTVWVDEHGTVVRPPVQRHPVVSGATAATLAVVALVAVLAGLRCVVVWRLDRRRLRSWEAEWLIVGPLWSRR